MPILWKWENKPVKHLRALSAMPVRAQGEGLCTNITGDLQARFCFILAFFSQVLVPLILPFIRVKTDTTPEEGENT